MKKIVLMQQNGKSGFFQKISFLNFLNFDWNEFLVLFIFARPSLRGHFLFFVFFDFFAPNIKNVKKVEKKSNRKCNSEVGNEKDRTKGVVKKEVLRGESKHDSTLREALLFRFWCFFFLALRPFSPKISFFLRIFDFLFFFAIFVFPPFLSLNLCTTPVVGPHVTTAT